MNFLLQLLKKLPLKKMGPVAVVLGAVIAIIVVGYKQRWWSTLERHLGGWLWVGLLLLVVAGSIVVFLWMVPRYREKRFLSRLASEDEKAPHDEEQESRKRLQTRIKEAIRTLQNSPELRKKKGPPLYALPWYLLLGANQSGKSTLLHEVAKNFSPFAPPAATATGLTQDCDWWFFNTAIILDTAGSYAFPTEVERQGALWYRFLQFLRHYRALQPINGIIVTLAADAVASKGEEALRLEAAELRKRVDEAIRELGVNFPVYLLVTRCDLIEGFTEFFSCMPDYTSQQVFGYVHEIPRPAEGPQPDETAALAFGAVFTPLVERLQQLRLSIFNEEKLPTQELRQKVFCFPEEFQALQQPLSTVIDTFLRPSPFQHTPFFRGIFFSSAQQQGTPVSFLRRELRFDGQSRAIEKNSKTYFLHDLFAVILPRDQSLVKRTKKEHKGRLLRHLFGAGGCVALCLGLLFLLTRAYQSDRGIVAVLEAARCDALPEQRGIEIALQQLDGCRQEIQALHAKNHQRPSWTRLFNQSGQRERELRQGYVRQFTAEVLTPLEARLAARLSAVGDTIPFVFLLMKRIELINTCLSQAGCPEVIAPVIQPDYQLMLSPMLPQPPAPEQVLQLQHTYEAYLRWATEAPQELERERQHHADRLRDWFASKEFAPSQILRWANQNYAAVTLQAYWEEVPAGRDRGPIQVEGAYTAAAWRQSILPFLQRASDVVPGMQPLLQEFQAAYRAQYFEQWRRFLSQFPSGELPWGKSRARRRVLAARLLTAESPYNRILDATLEHLQPFLPVTLPAEVAGTTAAVAASPSVSAEAALPVWVRVLQSYVSSESRKAYMDTLRQIGAPLAADAPKEKSFRLAQIGFQERIPTETSTHPVLKAAWIIQQLQEKSGSDKEAAAPFWLLLERPVLFSWRVILENTAEFLQQTWAENVVAPAQGLSQMEQMDFLYGPQGKVREIVDRFVQPFLLENETGFRQVLGEELPLLPEFFNTLRDEKQLKPTLVLSRRTPHQVRVEASRETDISSPTIHRDDKTEFQLECVHKPFRITNRPTDSAEAAATVFWSFETCSDVTITIFMSCNRECVERATLVGEKVAETKTFPLKKQYPGQAGFLRFVQDFTPGKHTFKPSDFADSYPAATWQRLEATLRSYRIEALHVFYDVRPPPALMKLLSLTPGSIVPQTLIKE